MKKRILSFLLVLCMLLSMLPVFASSANEAGAAAEEGLAKDESSAVTSFYDLYVTDGLVAFYDAFDTESDVLDLENGLWYAKIYNAATGEFEKTTDEAYTAIIGGGAYSDAEEAPNLTGWVKGDKGFSYFTNSSIGANKISFPVSLISSLEKYTAEFVGRVDLREVHDAQQETGTVTTTTADGKVTYTYSGLTVLTYNGGGSYCTNRAYYTVKLKGEANAEVDIVINNSAMTVTLDEEGNYVYMAACLAKDDTYTIVAPETVEVSFSKDMTLNSQFMSNSAFVFGTLHGTHWTNKLGDNNWGNGKGNVRWYTGSADWGTHNGNGGHTAYGGSFKDSSIFKDNDGKVAVLSVAKTELSAGESYSIKYGQASFSVSGNKNFNDYKFDVLSNTCGAAYAFRLYNRVLNDDEKKMNEFVDKMIYNDMNVEDYLELLPEHREIFRGTVEALDFEAGKDAYVEALENVLVYAEKEAQIRAMTNYDKMYVGADGSKTENGGGLVALYSAYKGNTDSIDIVGKAWRNKVTKNDATIAGTPYDEATGNGYWRLREDGGLGYDLSVSFTSSLGFTSRYNNASGVNITLDPALIATPDFAVEYVVRYEYMDLDNGTGVIGKYTGTSATNDTSNRNPATIIGLFKDYAVRAGTFDNINRGIRWFITDGKTGWGSGDNTYNSATWGDTSRSNDDIVVQTVSRNETAESDGSYSASYSVFKDSILSVKGEYSSAETVLSRKYFKDAPGQLFQLFRQMPVSVFAIRVYDAELTTAEMARNRLVDLAAYCGADLTAYIALAPELRAIVDTMMAGAAFTDDKDALEATFANVVSALENKFDMNSTLYITEGLDVLLMAYQSMNSGTLVTGEKSVSWFNAVKQGTFATLRGTGWELLPEGGFKIVKNYDQFMADRTFGLYLDKEMLPEGAYTVEIVANPVGITNNDGTRYIDEITTYGLNYDNGFAIGPLRALQFVSYRTPGKDGQLEKRWIYQWQEGAWNASGFRARFGDTSWRNLGLDQILTYTISLEMEEGSGRRYSFMQDGKAIGSFSVADSDVFTNEQAGNKFQLMVGVAGRIFACRVYNRTLSPIEVLQNHLADLVYFYDLNADFLRNTIKGMDDASAVFEAFKDMGFDLPKEEAQKYFESKIAAIWLTYNGFAIRNDYTDGIRYYFDLNMGGIEAMLQAGSQIEIGTVINVGKDSVAVLDNYGYDYKIVAFDSEAGKTNGFFIDDTTFAVTVRYNNANKPLLISELSVRGYVKLIGSDGTETVFYCNMDDEAPNSMFTAYDTMSTTNADVLLEDLSLNDYVSSRIAASYDAMYVHLDSSANVGGNGTEEAPFKAFNDAFDMCRLLMKEITKPTHLYLYAADGVYGVYDTITFDGSEKPYRYCDFVITSANGKSTLTTSIDIDAADFVAQGDNMYTYQFEPDENGNYPEFRYLYVNDAQANLSASGATRAADMYGIFRTGFEREYDNIYETARKLFEDGTLTLETMPESYVGRADLEDQFIAYRDQFVALLHLMEIPADTLDRNTIPTGEGGEVYMNAFEALKVYRMAYFELVGPCQQYGAASATFAALTTSMPKPDANTASAEDTAFYNSYVAAFNTVKQYMIDNKVAAYDFASLVVCNDPKLIGKYYLDIELVGDLNDMIAEGKERMLEYADALEAELLDAILTAEIDVATYTLALEYSSLAIAMIAPLDIVSAEKLGEEIAKIVATQEGKATTATEAYADAEKDHTAKVEAYLAALVALEAAKAAYEEATEENEADLATALAKAQEAHDEAFALAAAAETALANALTAAAKASALLKYSQDLSAAYAADNENGLVNFRSELNLENKKIDSDLKLAQKALDTANTAYKNKTAYIAELRDENLWVRHALTQYKIEMHMAAQWDYNIIHITGVDYADFVENADGSIHVACYMEMSQWPSFVIPGGYTAKGRYVFLKNILKFVDSENEFFYDKSIGKLYYYTENDILDLKFSYPTSDYMFMFYNIEGMSIVDMTFTGVDDNFLASIGHLGGQSGSDGRAGGFPKRSAIYLENVDGMLIQECDFYDLGVEGITARQWIEDLTIEGCTFRNIGAAAIRIGGNTNAWDEGRVGNLRVTITNNYLDNIATEYHQSSAFQLASCKDCTLTNNTVKNTSYTAFSIGWRWNTTSWKRGEGINLDGMDISYNYIQDFMTELADGGAIYMLGGNAQIEDTSYFNFLHHNYIVFTKLSGNGLGGMICGIYFDGSCTNWHCYQNVVVEQSYGAIAAEDEYEDYGMTADERQQKINRRNGSTFYYTQHISSQLTYNILYENNYLLNTRSDAPDAQHREAYKTYIVASRNIKESGTRYIRDLDRIPSACESIIYASGAYEYAGDPTLLYGNDY